MSLERALELAERGRGTAHPNPVVGAVLVPRRRGRRRGLARAQGRAARRGERARGRRGARAGRDALRDHGAVLAPRLDAALHRGGTRGGDRARRRRLARPQPGGGRRPGAAPRARASRWSWWTRSRRGSRTRPGAPGSRERRPFVTYKVAVTLDGRVTVPGERWVSGEESRRLVHELRAASDAVAVGMGTVRADDPRLDARGVDARRQPRRLAFGRGPLPAGIGARAPQRAAARGARGARRRGRPVAPARGRADARHRVPARRSRRQAAGVRRAEAGRRGAAVASRARPPRYPAAFDGPPSGEDVL